MTTWQCSGCKKVWSAEEPPAECACGCRLIRGGTQTDVYVLNSAQSSLRVEATSRSNLVLIALACGLGLVVFLVAIIGGVRSRQHRLAERARLEEAVRQAEKQAHDAEVARAEAALRLAEETRESARIMEARRVADEAAKAKKEREEAAQVTTEERKEQEVPRKKKGLVVEGFENVGKSLQENKDELLRDTVIEMMRQEGYRVFPEQEVRRRVDLLKENFKQRGKSSRPKFS